MTLEELLDRLNKLIKAGRLDPEEPVMIRNTAVSEEAMEAGSYGYAELSELLDARGRAMLLIEEEY